MFTTCDEEKCRVVGNAEPQPNMFTSNFSIPQRYKKRVDETSTLFKNIRFLRNYFLPSNCCFKAAKASMSPKVVDAAWF